MNCIDFADKPEELRSRIDDLQQRLAHNPKSNQIEPIQNDLKNCLKDLHDEEQKRDLAENAPLRDYPDRQRRHLPLHQSQVQDVFGYVRRIFLAVENGLERPISTRNS